MYDISINEHYLIRFIKDELSSTECYCGQYQIDYGTRHNFYKTTCSLFEEFGIENISRNEELITVSFPLNDHNKRILESKSLTELIDDNNDSDGVCRLDFRYKPLYNSYILTLENERYYSVYPVYNCSPSCAKMFLSDLVDIIDKLLPDDEYYADYHFKEGNMYNPDSDYTIRIFHGRKLVNMITKKEFPFLIDLLLLNVQQ